MKVIKTAAEHEAAVERLAALMTGSPAVGSPEMDELELLGVLIDDYEKRFPEAIRCLEEGLEDSLSFYDFPEVDKKRISSTNGQERLNMEIRRRSRVVGVFPSVESYVRLTICYLIEYAEDWASERSYIREDKVLGSLDRLHELTAQAAN